MAENGLMITQPIIDGKVYSIIWDVETGQSMESFLELPIQSDPQKIGSAISYFRRYTCSSILSISAEDDDGNKASKKELKKPVILTDVNIDSIIEKGTQTTEISAMSAFITLGFFKTSIIDSVALRPLPVT